MIEYSASAKWTIQGNGWTAYRREKSGLSKAFDEIWSKVRESKELSYTDMTEVLRGHKEWVQSKGYRSVWVTDEFIEVGHNGVLPIIWIEEQP